MSRAAWRGRITWAILAAAGITSGVALATGDGARSPAPLLVAQAPSFSKQPLAADQPSDQVEPMVLVDGPDRVYRFWVDERQRGLGGDIRFSRSGDGGDTWSAPITLDVDKAAEARSHMLSVAIHRGRLPVVWRTKSADGNKFVQFQLGEDGGTRWLPQSRRLDYTAGAFEPSLAVDGTGSASVAWSDEYSDPGPKGERRVERRVFVARSGDLGTTWARAAVLSTIGAQERHPMYTVWRPLLAAGPDRQFYLAWFQSRPEATDVLFRRSEDGGVTWSEAAPLAEPGANVYSDLELRHDSAGTLYLLWAEDRQGDRTLVLRRSGDGGKTWQPALRFGVGGPGHRGAIYPAIATGPGGLVAVAWSDVPDGRPDIYLAVSRDHGQNWAAPVRMDRDGAGTAISRFPALAIGLTGQLAVAWQDDRAGLDGIYLNASPDAGRTWLAADVRVDAPAARTEAQRARLAVDSLGRIHVVWQSHVDQRVRQLRQVHYRRLPFPTP